MGSLVRILSGGGLVGLVLQCRCSAQTGSEAEKGLGGPVLLLLFLPASESVPSGPAV